MNVLILLALAGHVGPTASVTASALWSAAAFLLRGSVQCRTVHSGKSKKHDSMFLNKSDKEEECAIVNN